MIVPVVELIKSQFIKDCDTVKLLQIFKPVDFLHQFKVLAQRKEVDFYLRNLQYKLNMFHGIESWWPTSGADLEFRKGGQASKLQF